MLSKTIIYNHLYDVDVSLKSSKFQLLWLLNYDLWINLQMIYMLLFPLSFLDKHFSNWCLPKVPNAKYDLKEIK